MCQNDAHIFVRPEQIKEEIKSIKINKRMYIQRFGFKDHAY